tara:strand:+ start:349 stop:555 length:207 start_codon:yes stop_codon:yes gene_type:complete
MEDLEMSLSRKHFRLFANLVKQQKALAEKHDSKTCHDILIQNLCYVFKEDNPNFREDLFRSAITTEEV